MKKLFALAISVVFGMSMFFTFAMPTMAAENMTASGESCPIPSFTRPTHFSGYMGALVMDDQYNTLGRVVDVLGGGNSGQWVHFLVVSSCLPGMNGRLVAVPFNAVNSHQSVGTVATSVTQEQFQKAPSFSNEELNGWGYSRWVQDDYKYFQETL